MAISVITPRTDAGKTYIKDQKVFWEISEENILEINISAIRAIGEYTTMHALHRNEWFTVFALSENESFQISTYAAGMEDVLKQLSEVLNSPFEPKLASARDFQSNTLWPGSIAGNTFYELRIIEAKTLFDRFRARLGFGSPVELVFTDSVREVL